MNLSVCIIAKDEEKHIENCLRSLVDKHVQIIVVDTGSQDDTKNIALKYTSCVYDYQWNDDFGAAKQFAVSKADNDNILILDCDEYLQGEEPVLIELCDMLNKYPYKVGRIKCINILNMNNIKQDKSWEWISRAFNRKFCTIYGKIHEQIISNSGEAVETFLSGIIINHMGYCLNDEERKAKAERNIKLLVNRLDELKTMSEESEEQEIPYILYQLGKSYYMEKEYVKACDYFSKGLSYDLDTKLEYVIDMVETYGYAMLNSGAEKEAMSFVNIYDEFGDSADFKFLMGLIYMKNGLFDNAVKEFKKAVLYEDCKVEGVNSYQAYYNIGVIYECMGYRDKALEYYEQCGDYENAQNRVAYIKNN